MTSRKRWLLSEDKLIAKWYRVDLNKLVVLLPGRTRRAIIIRANRLGVIGRTWSRLEDEIIRNCYPDWGSRYCQRYMAHRTLAAIQNRAARLGVKRKLDKLKSKDPTGDIIRAWNMVISRPWH